MDQKLNLGLSLVAGLLLLAASSRTVYLPESCARRSRPPPPKTITAERFILKNEQGTTAGVFGLRRWQGGNVAFFDSTGRVI